MASQLYSRYVPPKNTSILLHKPTDSTTLPSNIIFSASQKISDGEPPQQLRSSHLINKEYSKAPKRKHESDDAVVDGEPYRKKRQEKDNGSHHKTLLKKKERAVKKSNDLIEKAPIRVEKSVETHPLQPFPQPEHAPESTKSALPSASNIPLPFPVVVSADTGAPFTELGIPKAVTSVLQSKGFEKAFPIQSAMIPHLLSRKPEHRGDILVSAATGSGKTLGYVLPIIADISRKSIPRLRALIIVPTRDLLYQTHKVCEIGASAFAVKGRRRVRVGTACGDVAYKQEVSNLMSSEKFYDPAKSRKRDQLPDNKWCYSDYDTEEGNSNPSDGDPEKTSPNYVLKSKSKVDILISTPGRLVQHLQETKGFELNYIDWLIIDEVDRILNQTYQALIKNVMSSLSNDRKRLRKKVLLSATLSTNVGDLSHLKLHNPKILVLEPNSVGSGDKGVTSDVGHVKSQTLKEFVIHLRVSAHKPLQLLKLLENEKIINDNDDPNSPRGALIFTNSNESAHRLARLLQLLKPSTESQIGTITSNVSKSVRTKLLRAFEERKLSIIIASDIMSRGIDLPSLGNVINYDMPTIQTSYIHRVGRTARAGKVGKAWTFFTGSKTQLAISQAEQTIPSETLEMDLEVDETEIENFEIALKILAKEAGNA